MWKQIEGSQKYLPATPGRHVIQDAGAWTQLDNATWKSRRHVRIILLNDYILIAAVKKKRVEEGAESRHAESKVVAERCWSLLDVELVDLATENFVSSGGRTNVEDAISIRAIANESFTYRADKPGDGSKTSLLLNFRKAVDELRRNQRSEIDSQNKAKETINYFASRDPGLLKKTDLLETLSDYKDRPNILIEVDGKQQNLRWVEGQVDELDINIALQHFESAVAGVEKLKGLAKGLKSNLVAQDFISFKVEERADKLAGLITQELVDTHNNLKKTKCNTSWLSRLGFEDRAREAYLEARSDIILKRSRYVSQVPKFALGAVSRHLANDENKAMCLRRQPGPVHLADFLRLLHPHQKHRLCVSAMLSPSDDERVRQVGERASRCFQQDFGEAAQWHQQR